MDSITAIATVIATLIGAVSGGGLLYYRQTRKIKEIEAEAKQSAEWKKLFDQSDEDSREKDKKIDALYEERQQLYKQLIERDKTIAQKDIQIERLRFMRCFINGCRKRQPKREYETFVEAETDTENETGNPTLM